jgi:hypothetical protein
VAPQATVFSKLLSTRTPRQVDTLDIRKFELPALRYRGWCPVLINRHGPRVQ